jgi:KRAB domain-containing zinc finger protein
MQNTNNLNSLPTKENSPKLSFSIQETENENGIQIHEELSPKKNNICEFCHKPFSTLGNMRNHIMTIHQNYRPFKCTYPGCNKKYSIESRFQVHMRTHIGAKPFVCQICSKSFNEKGNLKTHLRFHSELRPFKCPHCTKSYKTNGHLKDHIEIQHNLIKKYECQYCNKKFGRISTLKAHIRTHTGEKNFKCKMAGCEKWFAEKGNMEIHYRRHLKKLNKIDEFEKIKKKNMVKKILKKIMKKKYKKLLIILKI